MNIYLSENRVLLLLLCSSFVYTFLEFPFLGWTLQSLSFSLCASVVVLYVLVNLETVFNLFEYRYTNALVCICSLYTLVSKAYNGDFSLFVLITFLFQCAMIPFIELQREKGHVNFLIRVFLAWYGTGLFINDVLMVVLPGRFYGDGFSKYFFLGNKFSVGYNHIVFGVMLCLLYAETGRLRKWNVALLFLMIGAVCYYIDCRTAVMGTIAALLVFLLPDIIFDRVNSRPFLVTAMILCAFFVLAVKVVYVPSIKYFVTEVLKRDISLTGRQQIFAVIPRVVSARPLLGYGASNRIMYQFTGAYNAQNGFFDIAVSNGFPAAVLYVLLVTGLFRQRRGNAARMLAGAVYAFIFMSTVEVTYGMTLLLFCALIMTDSPAYREEEVRLLQPGSVFSIRFF